jgi:hypothetical protein
MSTYDPINDKVNDDTNSETAGAGMATADPDFNESATTAAGEAAPETTSTSDAPLGDDSGEQNLSVLDDVAHPFDQTNGIIEEVEEHAGDHLDNAHNDPDPDPDLDPDRRVNPLAEAVNDIADGDFTGEREERRRERE